MSSETPANDMPPCPECTSVATVLDENREPSYIRCNDCGHVWEHGSNAPPSPAEPV